MSVTRIQPSEPYSGDDWAQTLARWMWLPLTAMGVMAAGVGLVATSYAGVQLGDFFGGASVDHFGRATTTNSWAIGTTFLGMAFLLSGITMVLVNVISTLRDTGRDVQRAVGTDSVRKLKKPFVGELVPHVMMMGLVVVVAGFGLGIAQAALLGGLPATGLAATSTLSGHNLANYGTAQAIGAWLQPLRLFGLALIFVSIVLSLRTIIRTIRYQGQRVEELARETGHTVAA